MQEMQETRVELLSQEESPGGGNGNLLMLLPGKFHGNSNSLKSLKGYRQWGPKESDTTEHSHVPHLEWCMTYLYYLQQ